MSSFSIVEFTADKTVDIVPANWVLQNGKCWWPDIKGPALKKVKTDGRSQPDFNKGMVYEARVIKTYDSYAEARLKLAKAEDTSALDSLSEGEQLKSRKQRKRKHPWSPSPSNNLSSSEDSGDSISLIDLPEQHFRNDTIVTGNDPLIINTAAQIDEINRNVNNTVNDFSQFLSQPFSKEIHRNVNNTVNDCSQFLSQPFSKEIHRDVLNTTDSDLSQIENDIDGAEVGGGSIMDAIKKLHNQNLRFQRAVIKRLIKLKRDVDEIRNNSLRSLPLAVDESMLPKFPIENLPELLLIEDWLRSKENVDILMQHLSSIGGSNIKESTRRILGRVFHPEFSLQINWTGKNGKHGLMKFMISKVIISSVRLSHATQNVTDKEVEETIKSWFRFAKDREGGRDRRKVTNEM